MKNELDVKKLVGCDNLKDINTYLVQTGSLTTDPSNLKGLNLRKMKVK
jgi:hypothetical protein